MTSAARLALRPDRDGVARAPADLPGYGDLLADGWLVELGPALVAGTSLAQRTLARMADGWRATLADLGAHEVLLPASEGEALVNLLVKTGALQAGTAPMAFALGAGFREDVTDRRGVFGVALYERLDVATFGSDDAPAAPLLAALNETLARWGLSLHAVPDDAPSASLDVTLPAGERLSVGRIDRRALGAGRDGRALRVVLATLDLFAVFGVLAEQGRSERGLRWPADLAPFDVGLLPPAGPLPALLQKIASELHAADVHVLIDDRDETPARRRQDMQRWGLPLRVLVGPAFERGEVVLESGADDAPERVAVGDLVARVLQRLSRAGPGDADAGGASARRRRALY